jgi:glycosyltransferase involved in cell wall biosynthesis
MGIAPNKPQKPKADPRACLFVNPHSHHTYFTVLALSQLYPVLILCPPLQIQLFQRRWSKEGLHFKKPSLCERLAQLAAICAFLLYKKQLIDEPDYVSILEACTQAVINQRRDYIFFHYQDYIRLSSKSRSCVALEVCEIIISVNDNSSNLKTTLQASSSADIVICPSTSMALVLNSVGVKPEIAPYGGNKTAFRKTRHRHDLNLQNKTSSRENVFIICARANSQRKGLDILLHSLLLLNIKFDHSDSPLIQVRICGSVAPGEDDTMLRNAIKALGKDSTISITAAQYTQDDYNFLLKVSDFFVMPSRLESTSLAALEALWHGTPCILSKECGVDTFVDGRHGILLDSLADTCLAEALYEIIEKPDLAHSVRRNLAKDRDLFDWNNYLNAYKNILSSSSLSD